MWTVAAALIVVGLTGAVLYLIAEEKE